jgi:MFS family permease
MNESSPSRSESLPERPVGQAGAPAPPPGGLQHALRLVLWDSIASELMGTLTTGVFLVGLAVALNASNFMIGVLAAIPFFVQLLQFPAVLVIERLRRRRGISVFSSGLGRCFLVAVAAAPLLPPHLAITFVAAALAVHQGFGAISGCAWNSWMRDLVPEDRYGRFFGLRNFATTALSLTLSLGAGVFIDAWNHHAGGSGAYAYSLMFLLGGLAGLFGVYLLAITPEPAMAAPQVRLHPFRLLAEPFHHSNFRRLIAFLAAWNFAVNLAAPFFAVYMLRTLGFAMSTVVALNVVSQISNLAFLHLWGRLSDRFGSRSVLAVAAPLFLFCLLAWSLTGLPWLARLLLALLVVLHILMGIATAGVVLASGNIAMKLSPIGRATAYLAANGVVTAVSASLASLFGGACADFFAAHELSLSINWKGPVNSVAFQALNFHSWTFFFALAFILGLYSLRLLALVEEKGELKERIAIPHLVAETRRSIHSLSSAAGLQKLARFPFARLGQRRLYATEAPGEAVNERPAAQ